jgi:small nuclear ribonucleoprotein (snRNP)-like protein
MLSLATALFSCQSDVEFNDPAFQARINNTTWKANLKSATIVDGQLTLNGTSQHYNLMLKTSSAAVGTYFLGTTNQTNKAIYTSVSSTNDEQYTTGINAGSVYEVVLQNGGNNYVTVSGASTSGGTGSGLKVNVEANPNGSIKKVTISAPGTGYLPGDVVTIASGGNNARLLVRSVANSNGEVVITENTGSTISGKFKFTAFDGTTGNVVSCKEGVFYNMPLQ